MKSVNEGYLKKSLILVIIGCRIVLLLSFWISNIGLGTLTDDEFQRASWSILPLTILFVSFSVNYIRIHKRYFHPEGQISNGYLWLSWLSVFFLHCAEFMLVCKKGWFFQSGVLNDMDTLYKWLTWLEAVLALYTGIYLSTLFTAKKSVN